MDALVEHRDAVDAVVAGLLRPLVDQDLSVVFYDLTTIRVEGSSTQQADVRQFGMSKEGIIARQFMLGVVQTAEGLPIYHEVFDGNVAETTTLLPTLQKVLARFPSLKRVVLVADRGLLSLDNLEALQALRLNDTQPVEFIIAVPGRRYGDFVELLAEFQKSCAQASQEITGEVAWNGLRLVMAHDPQAATDQRARRREQIADLERQADAYAKKLEGQEVGITARGRKLSSSGAKARFYHEVAESHLRRIIKVDTTSDQFSYYVDDDALAQAELMDGKLLLVTNVTDMTPERVIERYKSLADIERGFKVLKAELEIGPVFHRLPDRIRAHALICFMALILHRVMRMRLRAANAGITPERAIEALQRIQHHRITLNHGTPLSGVSSLTADQLQVLKALKVQRPTEDRQLSLL
jgi:transposase